MRDISSDTLDESDGDIAIIDGRAYEVLYFTKKSGLIVARSLETGALSYHDWFVSKVSVPAADNSGVELLEALSTMKLPSDPSAKDRRETKDKSKTDVLSYD